MFSRIAKRSNSNISSPPLCEGMMRDGSPCANNAAAQVTYTCAQEDVRHRRFCRLHVRLLQNSELYCLPCYKRSRNKDKHALILVNMRWFR